ncbi:hypothetical protein BJ684DRAFT_17183, partial [Piptocephalis cylindrospora]
MTLIGEHFPFPRGVASSFDGVVTRDKALIGLAPAGVLGDLFQKGTFVGIKRYFHQNCTMGREQNEDRHRRPFRPSIGATLRNNLQDGIKRLIVQRYSVAARPFISNDEYDPVYSLLERDPSNLESNITAVVREPMVNEGDEEHVWKRQEECEDGWILDHALGTEGHPSVMSSSIKTRSKAALSKGEGQRRLATSGTAKKSTGTRRGWKGSLAKDSAMAIPTTLKIALNGIPRDDIGSSIASRAPVDDGDPTWKPDVTTGGSSVRHKQAKWNGSRNGTVAARGKKSVRPPIPLDRLATSDPLRLFDEDALARSLPKNGTMEVIQQRPAEQRLTMPASQEPAERNLPIVNRTDDPVLGWRFGKRDVGYWREHRQSTPSTMSNWVTNPTLLFPFPWLRTAPIEAEEVSVRQLSGQGVWVSTFSLIPLLSIFHEAPSVSAMSGDQGMSNLAVRMEICLNFPTMQFLTVPHWDLKSDGSIKEVAAITEIPKGYGRLGEGVWGFKDDYSHSQAAIEDRGNRFLRPNIHEKIYYDQSRGSHWEDGHGYLPRDHDGYPQGRSTIQRHCHLPYLQTTMNPINEEVYTPPGKHVLREGEREKAEAVKATLTGPDKWLLPNNSHKPQFPPRDGSPSYIGAKVNWTTPYRRSRPPPPPTSPPPVHGDIVIIEDDDYSSSNDPPALNQDSDRELVQLDGDDVIMADRDLREE